MVSAFAVVTAILLLLVLGTERIIVLYRFIAGTMTWYQSTTDSSIINDKLLTNAVPTTTDTSL